jgi:hypothetical protein
VAVVTHLLKYLFLMTSGALFLLVGSVAAAEGELRVSRDRPVYLKHDGGTFLHYLELRPDGSYRRVARGHLYVEERDHGKWKQNDARKLLLRSNLRFRNINSGDLLIPMWHRDRLKTLPDLRQRIHMFLKANRAKEFPAELVERIRETGVSTDSETNGGGILVLGAKRVHRSDLEKLASAIDTLEYNASTVFVDDDQAQLTKSIISDELGGSSHPKQAADKHGYFEIDAAQFNKEVKEAETVLAQP